MRRQTKIRRPRRKQSRPDFAATLSTDESQKNFAWEPLTPRGVAAFAGATLGRLLLVQFIAALLVAMSIVWFLDDSCYLTIRDAIQNLPDSGKISGGKLVWPDDSPKLLAEGKFLALDADLNHSGQIHSAADVQVEFGENSVRVFSLLGYVDFFYPPDRFAPFNRAALEPLWGAWSAEILFAAAAATMIGLLISWWVLATLYFMPLWIFGFYLNRRMNFRASWKLSGAALLPGALLMAAGILLYDFGIFHLVSFAFIFGAHFILGWIYLLAGSLFLPRISSSQSRNPFHPRH
jgi:hypothetical protein